MIKLSVGDIWKFDSQNDYFMHILKIDKNIIHIAIIDDEQNYIVEHMPFDIDIIKKNVVDKIGYLKDLPNYDDGYNYWKKEYDSGNAGIYAITITEALKL